MTTLILAQTRSLSFNIAVRFGRITERFLDLNRNGIITSSLIAFIAAAALTYLAAMYIAFDFGFSIQLYDRDISRLETSLTNREVKLQELRTSLVGSQAELLKSMEKISSMKYIVNDGLTAALPVVHP